MAEGRDRCDNHRKPTPASSSPLSSPRHSSTQTWPRAGSPPQPRWMNGLQVEQDEHLEEYQASTPRSSPRLYEELFCSSQSRGPLAPLVPLSGALLASSRPQSDAVKQGYLGKMEHNHRRYFVLRAGSHTGLSRLEWYKSQEKFTEMEKSAGKAALFGSSKQGVIYLRCCLGVSRTGSSRKGHTVALYARDQTMVLVVGDQEEQEAWYLAIKTLMEEEQNDEEHGQGFDEDDDGYCTLPPAAFFRELGVNEMAEGRDRCDNHRKPTPASSSPLSSPRHSSTQTWPRAGSPPQPRWMNGLQVEQDEHLEEYQASTPRSSPRLYEELFCSSQSRGPFAPLVPLSGALLASSRPQSDAVKQGYLGKMEHNHRRYFVLRAGSHTGLSRLEWYKSQEKFTEMEKSAGKAALFGSSKQGVIYLRCCLGVSRTGSSRKGHTVALYARDQTMVLVVGDQEEQEAWYLAIKTLMEEEQKDEEHGQGFDEDDDGYCTLPPAAFFREVWPVSVKPRGLGRSRSLTGESRLCLTATSLILVRVTTCSNLPSVTIPLLSVRRFGHLDGLFFMELGRSAPDGPGEIWMEARDPGNPAIAQQIHEVVRETVRALRALPDFNRSPTSNPSQPQALMFSKRSRPKYRDKPVNVRLPCSVLVQPPRNPDTQTSSTPAYEDPCRPDRTPPNSTLSPIRSQRSSSKPAGSYMEMKMEQCRVEAWEQEEQQGGPGYMEMSPQGSHSSSLLPQDDYMTMASPQKCHWPQYSSPSSILHKSFDSSTSDSPVQTSHQPHWQLSSVQQPQMTINPVPTMFSSSFPAHTIITSQRGSTRPVQTSPKCGTWLLGESVPDQPAVRRSRLSSCLFSCLQAEESS